MSAKLPITAVVLTFDEVEHIDRLLACLAPVERVVLVDSGSTDGTVERARAAGAEVLQRPFTFHAEQFEWGMAAAKITSAWTLRIDADEVIEPDLWANIAARLADVPEEVTGMAFDRKHIFMGKFVRHGGRYPLTLLRLWRTGAARVEQRWMDEHVYLLRGRSIRVPGGFADWNLKDSAFFTAKHNNYATREAIDVLVRKYGLLPGGGDVRHSPGAGSAQAGFKRRWKERVYNRLPFGVGPLLYFLLRFTVQLGFLDGRKGRIYHVLQGFWYRYLCDVRKLEFEQAIAGARDDATRLALLSRASGIDLSAYTALGERSGS